MGNPDAKNRCDREMPTARPRGIGADCWTPKQLAKYGLDPAEVGAEPCVRRKYGDFLYEWNDCVSACYVRKYGTQPVDELDRRQLENKNKNKKNEKDTDGDGVPDRLDDDIDGDGKSNEEDTDNEGPDSTKPDDKENEDFPDTEPPTSDTLRRRPKRTDVKQYDATSTSWRVLTICRAECASRTRLDYTPCFCDRVIDGNDDPLEGTFDRDPVDDPGTAPDDRPDIPDDGTPPVWTRNKLNVTDSAYGVPIEVIYGRHLAAGNIFWIAPTRREEQVSARSLAFGSSTTANGATVITSPVIDFAIGLSAPEIDAVMRIYFNDLLFYDVNAAYARVGTFCQVGQDDVSNGTELIKDHLFFYRGGEAQKFAHELATEGEYPIGYRDLCFLVFRGLDLRVVGNKFPSLRVEVASRASTSIVTTDAAPPILPTEVRAFGTNKIFVDEAQPGAYKVVSTSGTIVYNVVGQSFDVSTATIIADQYVATKRGAIVESRSMASGAVLSQYTHPISDLAVYGRKSLTVRARSAPGTIENYFVIHEAPHVHFHKVEYARGLVGARTSVSVSSGTYGGIAGSYTDLEAKSVTDALFFVHYNGTLKVSKFVLASTSGAEGFTFKLGEPPKVSEIAGNIAFLGAFVATGIAFDNTNAMIIVQGRVGTKLACIAIEVSTMTLAWAHKYEISAPLDPVWFFAIGGLNGVMSISSDAAYAIDTRTGAIENEVLILGLGDRSMSASGGAVLITVDANKLTASNLTGLTASTIPVGDIVYDIAQRARLNMGDVYIGATDEIIGYKVNTNSAAKSFLGELATVTGSAVYDDGQRLRAERIDAATYTVDEEDIGESSSQGRAQIRLRDTASRPSTQTVNFYDADKGLTASVVSFRPDLFDGFAYGDDATFSTNVVLGTQDAAVLAERLASTITVADNVADIMLGPKHLRLTPGDVVSVPGNLFGRAVFMARDILLGADKVAKLSMRLSAEGWQSPNPTVPPVVDPPVVDPTPVVDAGTPVIIQAKPVFGGDVLDNAVTFYAGVIGNIGTTAIMYFLDGGYVARAEKSKPLTIGVVIGGAEDALPDRFGPQWEPGDELVVTFDSPPDTSKWINAKDINDITASSLIINLLLVGREWIQFRSYTVAGDGVTVTFSQLSRGLRGSDVYLTDTVLGRTVYVYDEDAWASFTITKASAMAYPATLVTRSLTNLDATPEAAQAVISMEPSFNWPVARCRLVRDMSTDFITLSWALRAKINSTLDDQWWFEVPGIETPTEIFIIKDDITYPAFAAGIAEVYADTSEWNSTRYVRAYSLSQFKSNGYTLGSFTSIGIDYLTDKFHIVLRQAENTINPSVSGHYYVATFDPAVDRRHVDGYLVEPSSYQVITIP